MSIEKARAKLPLHVLMEQHGDAVKVARREDRAIEKARAALPLRRLMEQGGHGAPQDKKSNFQCPFCQKKSAVLKTHQGREWFKCWHPECASQTSGKKESWDEVGYVAFVRGVSREVAYVEYLKMAGLDGGSRRCPFCQGNEAVVSAHEGREWFKCFNPRCPSDTAREKGAWDDAAGPAAGD